MMQDYGMKCSLCDFKSIWEEKIKNLNKTCIKCNMVKDIKEFNNKEEVKTMCRTCKKG